MNCIFCNQELKLIDNKYSIIYRCDNCIYDVNYHQHKAGGLYLNLTVRHIAVQENCVRHIDTMPALPSVFQQ
jgi:hypothetical protein